MSKFNSALLETPEQVQAAIAADAAKRKQPEPGSAEARQAFQKKTAWGLGSAVGLPTDAATYVLWLEGRILALEERLAKVEAPAHLRKVEKR